MSTTYLRIVCPHVFPEIRGRTTQHRGFTGIYGVECAHHCRSRASIIRSISSMLNNPILFPIRSADKVLTCPINAHDFLGSSAESISSARGKPNLGCLLVSATAITICILSLKISLLNINTGRKPDCSCPNVGFKFAHRISPLSIRAIQPTPRTCLPLPSLFHEQVLPWRIHAQVGSCPCVPVSHRSPAEWLDCDSGTLAPSRADPGAPTSAHPMKLQPLLSSP